MAKILLVDDDTDILDLLSVWLKKQSHRVECCSTGSAALDLLEFSDYDAIILDVGLPDMDGFEVCRRHRASGKESAKGMILMLTARGDLEAKLEGLEAGADDYVPKPFSLEEISARLRALLRRVDRKPALHLGSLKLDPANHKVSSAGKAMELYPREFALLQFFLENPNKTLTVERILKNVWPDAEARSENALRTCIARLRKQLRENTGKELIYTIPGAGYEMKDPG
ncbi:MAG: response regulator transcription factor [Candidatus Obscuribacter sp.]|nr:response regulator transcription factor [Candidatus Obscuribacter sp.]